MDLSASYLQPGALLQGRYEIKDEIGRGGFSIVYEAFDLLAGKTVAVKLLVPPPAAAAIARERMRREYKALQQLDHPFVVRVLDLIDQGPWTCLILERVAGRNLQQVVREQGPLPPASVVQIACNVLQVLDVAHNKGILHRDVKPQNVLIGDEGQARLTDFGSVRMEGLSTLTHSGLVGTLDYMDPCVLEGRRADGRSDIYSLGLTLHFALTGKSPATRRGGGECCHPAEENSVIPDWLDQAIARSTQKQPENRFHTALNFLEVLQKHESSPASFATRKPDVCKICGNPALPGIPICNGCCTRIDRTGELLRINSCSGPEAFARFIHIAPQVASAPAAKDALRGRKALARVSNTAVPPVVNHFQNAGFELSSISWRRSMDLLSPFFGVFCALVLTAGFYVGHAASSLFYWLTVLIVAFMASAAIIERRRPLLRSKRSRSPFGSALHREITKTLLELRSDSGRNLLADIVAIAGRIYSSISINEWSGEAGVQLNVFVQSACDALRQLDTLDALLERPDAPPDAAPSSAYCECEDARDRLVQRLLESIGDLGAARATISAEAKELERTVAAHCESLRAEIEQSLANRKAAEMSVNIL